MKSTGLRARIEWIRWNNRIYEKVKVLIHLIIYTMIDDLLYQSYNITHILIRTGVDVESEKQRISGVSILKTKLTVQ